MCICVRVYVFAHLDKPSLQPAPTNNNLIRSLFQSYKNNCSKQALQVVSYVINFFYNYVQWINMAILVQNINIVGAAFTAFNYCLKACLH